MHAERDGQFDVGGVVGAGACEERKLRRHRPGRLSPGSHLVAQAVSLFIRRLLRGERSATYARLRPAMTG